MAVGLQNMRARPGAYDDDDVEFGSDNGESDISDEADDDEGMSEHEDQQSAGEEGSDVEQKISNVSFGALKQAQDAISRKRKRGSDTTADQEDKLEALREKLRQIRAQREGHAQPKKSDTSAGKSLSRTQQTEEGDSEDDSDDSDSAPSEEGAEKSRSSKHAPMSQSSKHQVTRKRLVVDVPKRQVRDPRFDAMHQRHGHPGDSDKAYAFLQDYQKAEIQELKGAMKKTKSEDDKEILKRKVISMENKLKAKAAKEREQEIIRKHRKEERDKVQEGKTPYYLKKKDIKERAIVEKFNDMKSKDREKLIEKRRKKEGQKEKKRMPQARRMVG
ncbi:rRNA biogenesis protein RRP36 [Fulvia fulva]|uniref:rRNA biogenesis protein RRP36 n=1 Tax=Passalora fulva TaxID=5499 RepID=A0A9Q8LA74_PASFU|nr:rRNA biogenesis protein RRP36 [Fulvia fulva]KAK4633260.1 rRNA biogenesis protein RRP36 [Fulvia fulva]UJO13713.1 rRNA biogenesis protein RRP36 [Fulvia fulva]